MPTQPKQQELFHIAGDTPEQVNQRTPDGAIESIAELNLGSTAVGHPKILYRDRNGKTFVLTADVYKYGEAPMKVVLLCPLCGERGLTNGLNINQGHKAIEFSPNDPVTMMLPDEQGRTTLHDMGGRIDIERFKCTWEENITAEVSRQTGFLKGVNLCTWQVVVERNVARDA